jgi:magnesium transporter
MPQKNKNTKPKDIMEIQFDNGFKWINIPSHDKKHINWLRENFDFEEMDLKDCDPINQRPKVNAYPHYNFMILQFPVYNRLTGDIESSEIDFFISKDYLITVHKNDLVPILDIFEKYKINAKKEFKKTDGAGQLLYEILNQLLHYCFPMLNHISQDIDTIENIIFRIEKNTATNSIKEILRIKRNIVNFRKIMQAHKNIISKLILNSENFFTTYKLKIYYSNLINHTKDIWDFLSNYKDTIDALHETQESLVSNKLNDIMKMLTIFSVIVFPLNLIAALFGMNSMNSMPFMENPLDFWIIVTIMVTGVLGMIFYFKAKKWI